MFTGEEVAEFARQYGIQMLHSTPYYDYAQANGQAEASNKALKRNLQKMRIDDTRKWHKLLSEVVWANRTSQKTATGTTPFRLVYGQDAMLPMELTINSLTFRRKSQMELTGEDYSDSMMIEMLDLDEERLLALDHLEAQKKRVEISSLPPSLHSLSPSYTSDSFPANLPRAPYLCAFYDYSLTIE